MSDYSRTNNIPSQTDSEGGATSGNITGDRRNSGHRKLKLISKSGPITLFSNPNSITIEAADELKNEGYMTLNNIGLDLVDKCEGTLGALGFTIVETEELSPGLAGSLKDFSLIGSTNEDTTIKNSKIVDPDLSKLTPVKDRAGDKFKDQNDSFYDLDQERSQAIKNINKKEKLRSQKSRAKVRLAAKMTESVKKSQNKMLAKVNKRSIKR